MSNAADGGAPGSSFDGDAGGSGATGNGTAGDGKHFEGAPAPSFTERVRARWAQRRHGGNGHQRVPERTAFVLAGGGSRGAVQVGMLQELIRRGIRADRVYGASVGAINGASYAGQPTLENAEKMADIWRAVKGTDIFPRGPLDGPWAFLQKRPSVHANTGLRAIIEAGIDYEYLEEATIPIEVVTTSLTDGRERWIGHGSAVEAVLASSAIPSIFPPVIIDGDMLVDGGVVNNVPISQAIGAGCDRIYVLLCGPLHYHPPPPRRPLEAQLTAFFVAIHARFIRELASLPPGVEVVVFSGGGEPSGQYRDFSATATLIEEGRSEVAAVLDRYVGTSQHIAHAPTPAPTGAPAHAAPPTPTPTPTPTTPTPTTPTPTTPTPTTPTPTPTTPLSP